MTTIRAALCILMFCGVGFAQTAQTPCLKEQLRADTAEERLKIERDKADKHALELSQEFARIIARANGLREMIAVTEQRNHALLQSVDALEQQAARLKQDLDAHGVTIKRLIVERDKARTWKRSFLRVFGIKRK